MELCLQHLLLQYFSQQPTGQISQKGLAIGQKPISIFLLPMVAKVHYMGFPSCFRCVMPGIFHLGRKPFHNPDLSEMGSTRKVGECFQISIVSSPTSHNPTGALQGSRIRLVLGCVFSAYHCETSARGGEGPHLAMLSSSHA